MIRSLTLIFSLILLMITAGTSMAARVMTPTEPPEGIKIISINEAQHLLQQKDVYIFDMRKELFYSRGHIPGAVSLPYKWIKQEHLKIHKSEFDMSKLPADKNEIIIFHDEGPDGWKSYYASKVAKDAGYKNIMWLRDGFSSWTDKGYSVEH